MLTRMLSVIWNIGSHPFHFYKFSIQYPNVQKIRRHNVMVEPIIEENQLFLDLLYKKILLVLDCDQLNILGQTFRPIFTGKVVEVTNGFITLDPVIIKMHNAPFYKFPTPLSFPMENIAIFTPFDPDTKTATCLKYQNL